LPPSDDNRGFLGSDGKGKWMQLDVHALSIPDVKLIRTPRISIAESIQVTAGRMAMRHHR
jgi:hypothetical protein